MNTSIPTSVSSDSAGAFAPAADPALAAMLGALPGASTAPAGAAFASLLADAPAAEAPAAAATSAPADPEGQGNVPVILSTPGTVLSRLAGAGLRPGLLTAAAHSPVLSVAPAALAPAEGAGEPAAPVAPTREEIEQALALLAPLWNLLAPTAAPASLPQVDGASVELTVRLQVAGERPRSATLELPATPEALAGTAGQLFAAVEPQPGTTPELPDSAAPAEVVSGTTDTLPNEQPVAPAPLPPTPVAVSGMTLPATPATTATAVATTGNTDPLPAANASAADRSDDEATEAAPARPTHSAEVRLPGGATLTVTVSASGRADQGQDGAGQQEGRQENYAGQIRPAGATNGSAGNRVEKQFLSAQEEQVSTVSAKAGITGAQKADAMPQLANNPRRFTSSSMPEPVPVRSALVEFLPAAPVAAAAPAPAAHVAAPESVAQRAVEAVMALVDSQRSQPAQGGLVNLSFKIGHDDLTVRVQLRGGVLQAQFRTDSPELRSALAAEWRAADPVSVAGSLRLAEPEFVPASASPGSFAQNGFAQGQSGSQQHAQQQGQAPSSLLFPELRGLRRGAPAPAESADPRPAAAYSPHALHLTAVA